MEIKGNMGAAMKFTPDLLKGAKRGYSSMFVREFSSDLKSKAIFDKMAGIIEERGESMVAKVGHVYHFGVRKEKGGDLTYFTMDLKNGTGAS